MPRTKRRAIVSSSPEETAAAARELAGEIPPGAAIALVGPLGSGKTVFVKGLARGLGIRSGSPTSPTYTLIHEHEGPVPLVHVDLYRLEEPEEIDGLGLEEYFDGPAVVAVEWAERAKRLLPAGTITVQFEILGPRRRRIVVGGAGPRRHRTPGR